MISRKSTVPKKKTSSFGKNAENKFTLQGKNIYIFRRRLYKTIILC